MPTFRTRVTKIGTSAVLVVPESVVLSFDVGTQVPVRVRVNEHAYSATIRRRGEQYVVRMGEEEHARTVAGANDPATRERRTAAVLEEVRRRA